MQAFNLMEWCTRIKKIPPPPSLHPKTNKQQQTKQTENPSCGVLSSLCVIFLSMIVLFLIIKQKLLKELIYTCNVNVHAQLQ